MRQRDLTAGDLLMMLLASASVVGLIVIGVKLMTAVIQTSV